MRYVPLAGGCSNPHCRARFVGAEAFGYRLALSGSFLVEVRNPILPHVVALAIVVRFVFRELPPHCNILFSWRFFGFYEVLTCVQCVFLRIAVSHIASELKKDRHEVRLALSKVLHGSRQGS